MAAAARSADLQSMMAEARRRSGRIDKYVDMIPSRYYLPPETLQAKSRHNGLDPAQYKPTSQLLAEALSMSSASAAASGSSSGKGRKKNGKAKREIREDAPSSATDLRQKLAQRINELKEERRKAQSEADKKKNAMKRQADVASVATPSGADKRQRVAETRTARPVNDEDIEAGRLSFEPKTSHLPFEAGVNRRGSKVRKLQRALSKAESASRKLEQAESRGERDEVRKELAYKTALQRAKGEKVHDDVARLRKAQKQLEMRKSKGKAAWDTREKERIKQSEDKQLQRKENIANKRSKKKKKQEQRHGFEGKKAGYINKDSDS